MEGKRYGRAYIIFVVFAHADLSEVLHKVFNIDPEDAVIRLLEMQLLA